MSPINNMAAWIEFLGDEWYLEAVKLADRLSGPNVVPPRELTFQALNEVSPHSVKVVILGQDPYPTPGRARGVAFGYHPDYTGQPVSSLANIMKESGATDRTLRSWTEQGVLLLNTRLTVEHGKPMSHAGKGWEPLIEEVIRKLMHRSMVWILLGAEARKLVSRVYKQVECEGLLAIQYIETTSHPCKHSAHRGFLGSGVFANANWDLQQLGYEEIDWTKN